MTNIPKGINIVYKKNNFETYRPPPPLQYRSSSTVCSASQCRLPFAATQLADAQSQTNGRGSAAAAVVSASSADVCSQTDQLAEISSSMRTQKGEKATARSKACSSHVQSQTDMVVISTSQPPPLPVTDDTAVQAVISSFDAMNQTDTTSLNKPYHRRSAEDDVRTTTTAGGSGGGQSLRELGHSVHASSSRDFQCQTWPESCDKESQAGTQDGP
ncbi:hypothetical protein ElyMa_001347200 [Elysia marginata]|uniref:Uncharacterized protein n=1 Tax=Elysia marginata TaxID=1093978 RepID=A0AAV4IR12_9GAST|nr:hypothetical protein ElyMa_001347200 [Elysia marginata]